MLVDEAELPITRSHYWDALDALRAATRSLSLQGMSATSGERPIVVLGLTPCMARWCWTLCRRNQRKNALRGTSAEDNALTQGLGGRLIELGGGIWKSAA